MFTVLSITVFCAVFAYFLNDLITLISELWKED